MFQNEWTQFLLRKPPIDIPADISLMLGQSIHLLPIWVGTECLLSVRGTPFFTSFGYDVSRSPYSFLFLGISANLVAVKARRKMGRCQKIISFCDGCLWLNLKTCLNFIWVGATCKQARDGRNAFVHLCIFFALGSEGTHPFLALFWLWFSFQKIPRWFIWFGMDFSVSAATPL